MKSADSVLKVFINILKTYEKAEAAAIPEQTYKTSYLWQRTFSLNFFVKHSDQLVDVNVRDFDNYGY